jgi:hypothetical protein
MPRSLSKKPAPFVSLAGLGDTARVNVVLTREDLEILDRARQPPLVLCTQSSMGGKSTAENSEPGTLSETIRRVIRERGSCRDRDEGRE